MSTLYEGGGGTSRSLATGGIAICSWRNDLASQMTCRREVAQSVRIKGVRG